MISAASNYGSDDTAYVVFRKVYDSESKTWYPVAFWYSTGQSMTYGKIYFIEENYDYAGEPVFYSDETSISYYQGSKRLLPTDDGYDELREYAFDWLKSNSNGEGFDRVVERQRLDNDMISDIWKRRI